MHRKLTLEFIETLLPIRREWYWFAVDWVNSINWKLNQTQGFYVKYIFKCVNGYFALSLLLSQHFLCNSMKIWSSFKNGILSTVLNAINFKGSDLFTTNGWLHQSNFYLTIRWSHYVIYYIIYVLALCFFWIQIVMRNLSFRQPIQPFWTSKYGYNLQETNRKQVLSIWNSKSITNTCTSWFCVTSKAGNS